MIEIPYEERKKVEDFYEIIKRAILSKKDKNDYYYSMNPHLPGITDYYNETGHVTFENVNGKIIKLKISRWHPHQHNGYCGFNEIPCLDATISIFSKEEEQIIWQLKVESGTMYYKALVSSLDFPNKILNEANLDCNKSSPTKEQVQDSIKNLTVDSSIGKDSIDEEPIDFINKFDELYIRYSSINESKKQLIAQQTEEIKMAIQKIHDSYSIKLSEKNEEIDYAKKALNDFEILFTKYSTFDIDLLGKTLQTLLTWMEQKEFLYSTVIHRFKIRVHGPIDSWDEVTQTKATIIVKQDKFTTCYESHSQHESKIDQLVQNGEAILLLEQNIYNTVKKSITFYSVQDGSITCHVDVGSFHYVKEFIDRVIQYRFQNNILTISEKDMLFLLKEFITTHKNIIAQHFDSKIKTLNL